MQTELEKWIEENRHTMHESVICEDLRFMGRGQSAIRESDLRALLSRFVLCEKEPVAWIAGEDLAKMQKTETSCIVFSVEMGYASGDVSQPLYAPADIGKEGGE